MSEVWTSPLTVPAGCEPALWAAARLGEGFEVWRPCLWLDQAGKWCAATLGEAAQQTQDPPRELACSERALLARLLLDAALRNGSWADVVSAHVTLGGVPPEFVPTTMRVGQRKEAGDV